MYGREELPAHEAAIRSAISIARRLQDPLSELVKIEPANIGVGLYQHDVKAKHLRDSLASVVESCVNYVGVDVNTASPALLRHVSGLSQTTARNLHEWRTTHGPFTSRQQFLDVPGFGEATYVQAVGFLKITDGVNPLDATWIHPESYAVATQVLERLGGSPADLVSRQQAGSLAEQTGILIKYNSAGEPQWWLGGNSYGNGVACGPGPGWVVFKKNEAPERAHVWGDVFPALGNRGLRPRLHWQGQCRNSTCQ